MVFKSGGEYWKQGPVSVFVLENYHAKPNVGRVAIKVLELTEDTNLVLADLALFRYVDLEESLFRLISYN